MIHQLLIALCGLDSDIFVPFPGKPLTPTTWIIHPDFPNLHISERYSINQLAKLGFVKSQLDLFIATNNDKHSAYLTALTIGVQHVLDQYTHKLNTLESDSLAGSPLSIPKLVAFFADSFSVLENVLDFVRTVSCSSHVGARILDLVVPNLADCRTVIADAYKLIARPVLYVFFLHLSQFLLYPEFVFDPFNEFFIRSSTDETNGKSSNPLTFHLDLQLIPSTLVSHQLANQILFAITSSYIVQQSPNHTELITPDTWQNQLSALSRLLDLNQSELRPIDLELAIHFVSVEVNRALWKILILDEKFVDYLQTIAVICLGGNGDFMRQFMLRIAHMESKSKAQHAQPGLSTRELNQLFQSTFSQVVARTYADSLLPASNLIDRLSYASRQDGAEPSHTPFITHEPTELLFDVPWPISLVITPAHVAVYSDIHLALLHMHRVLFGITDLHLVIRRSLIPRRNVPLSAGFYVCQLAATLQTEVMHTVRAILESITAVLDAEVRRLVHDFSMMNQTESSSITDWYARHASFVATVSHAVFLEQQENPTLTSAISKSLKSLLHLASAFVVAVETAVGDQTIRAWYHQSTSAHTTYGEGLKKYTHRSHQDGLVNPPPAFRYPDGFSVDHVISTVRMAADRFSQEAKFFYRMLMSAQCSGSAIVQELLVRLDFNKHWSLGPLRLSSGRSMEYGVNAVPSRFDAVASIDYEDHGAGRARRWETLQDTWLSGSNLAQEPHLPAV